MKKIISSRWFYVILFLSACVIITNIFITAITKKKIQEERTLSSAPKIINTEKVYDTKQQPDQENPTQTQPVPEDTITLSPVEEIENKIEFSKPVQGEILNRFSGNELVYSATLREYRIHRGIDIKSPILSQVRAVESGLVESVIRDGLMGITITIDHKNGFKSVYSNLSTDAMVKKGDSVEKGDIISGVGDTALIETGLEGHLHFELIENGKQVNPEDYF